MRALILLLGGPRVKVRLRQQLATANGMNVQRLATLVGLSCRVWHRRPGCLSRTRTRRVVLVELRTPSETNDNVVAF